MITGKTSSGFAFQVDAAALDDMELLEELSAVEENALYLPKVVKRLLGDDQKKALYDHLRGPDGRVKVEAVSTAVAEIFEAVPDGKN